MATKTFKAEDLKDLLDDNCETLEKVEDRITGKSRWSVLYALTFKETATGKFYQTSYGVGATEQQCEGPFENTDNVTCDEVQPVEKTVVVYERVPKAEQSSQHPEASVAVEMLEAERDTRPIDE